MKTFLSSLLAVIVLASVAFAANPTVPTFSKQKWEVAPRSSNDACTICNGGSWVQSTAVRTATTATGTIFTKFPLESGYRYALSILDSVVTDSMRVVLQVYGSDGSTLMKTVDIDTIRASQTYLWVAVKNADAYIGNRATLTVIGIGATGKKITRTELWRSKVSE